MKKIFFLFLLIISVNYASHANEYYLYGWGQNSSGQLGQSNTINYNFPKTINLSEVKKILSGRAHNLVLKSDSTIWAWGNNSSGQVGDGSNISFNQAKTIPLKISNEKWKSIFVGDLCSFAIAIDGSLWGWGSNSNGQLAYLDSSYLALPTKILDEKFKFIEGGDEHTLAIKLDSTLWGWGRSDYGQLGSVGNIFSIYKEPQQIGNGKWLKVSAGGQFSVGIKADSSLWSWGRNDEGQVGNGIPKNYNEIIYETEPVLIDNNKWISIDAGYNHTLAIKSDSTLWAWGYNINGALGDGTNINRNIPTQISAEKWVRISAGENFSIAMRSDSTLFVCGSNNNGQLGTNNNINQNILQNLNRKSNGQFSNGQHSIAILNSNIPLNIPKTGLLAYYPFNGNANDESGDGNHGVLLNGTQTTYDKNNLNNKAMQFDGNDDYIQTSLSHNSLLGLTEISGSAWIKLGNSNSEFGYTIFSTFYPSAAQLNFLLGGEEDDNHQKLVLFINSLSGGSQVIVSPNHIIPRNIWTHIAFTISSNLVNFYINGHEVYSENILFDELSSEAPAPDLKIGQGNPTNGFRQDFNGSIDEVALWNRALLSSEILSLFTESILSTVPTIQSKSITFHSITKNRIGLRWTKGNGIKRIVLASMGNLNNEEYLLNGTGYTAGNYGVNTLPNNTNVSVVYNGDNTTCLVEGLARNTTYYFRLFDYNGSEASANYLQTSASGNPSSKKTNKKESEEEKSSSLINVYPNPVKDVLNIEFNKDFNNIIDNAKLTIINEVGQDVYSTTNTNNLLTINTLDFANGVYHIIISNDNESIYHSFVVER